jgi:hypothetical protein
MCANPTTFRYVYTYHINYLSQAFFQATLTGIPPRGGGSTVQKQEAKQCMQARDFGACTAKIRSKQIYRSSRREICVKVASLPTNTKWKKYVQHIIIMLLQRSPNLVFRVSRRVSFRPSSVVSHNIQSQTLFPSSPSASHQPFTSTRNMSTVSEVQTALPLMKRMNESNLTV